MDIKTQLSEIYFSFLDEKLESKHLNWWSNCITNNIKTIDDFEKYILESDAYISKVSQLFKNTWKNYMNSEVNQDIEDNFIEIHLGKKVTVENIFIFLTKLKEYETVYYNIINDEYRSVFKEFAPQTTIDFYLEKFKNDMNYRDLQTDLQNKIHIDAENLVDEVTLVSEKVKPEIKKHIIEHFEEVFNRPMYVHEYFKYVLNNENVDEIDVHSIFEEQMNDFNRLQEIYKTYTGKEIDEYKGFISQFLLKNKDFITTNDPTFFDTIILTIVNSPEYESGIKKHINLTFKSMYDENLEEQDINYIFENIKKQKLSIVDDRIPRILGVFKQDTDDIYDHVFSIFLKVLERQPDMFETEKYMLMYRQRMDSVENMTYDIIDKDLENALIHSLEFHDVIKKNIKSIYLEIHSKEVLSSVLFSTLYKIIDFIGDDIKTKEEIMNRIKALF